MTSRILLTISLGMTLGAGTPTPPNPDSECLAKGQFPTSLALVDVNGRTMKFPPTGRPSVVTFWAHWAPPSAPQLEELKRVQAITQETAQVVAIALSSEGLKPVKAFVERRQIAVPVAVIVDEAAATKVYGLDTLPMTFVLNSKGEIASCVAGLSPATRIQQLLRGQGEFPSTIRN